MAPGYTPPERFHDAGDHLHELVIAETGSNDFGPDDYLPGLKVLLQSMLDRIYGFIGMDIPDTLRAGFTQRIEEKPELSHGPHRYSISDYAMTVDEAREPFREYIERRDLTEKHT